MPRLGAPPMICMSSMSSHQVVATKVRAIFPTNAGCAVFLGNDDKVFVIYVDPAVGSAIAMTMTRPSETMTPCPVFRKARLTWDFTAAFS